jgi:hypothetical protein
VSKERSKPTAWLARGIRTPERYFISR